MRGHYGNHKNTSSGIGRELRQRFRNRFGFTMKEGCFEFTHDGATSLAAMARVANDLANRNLVLRDILDVDSKQDYLDRLDGEGFLPKSCHALPNNGGPRSRERQAATRLSKVVAHLLAAGKIDVKQLDELTSPSKRVLTLALYDLRCRR